ncbi:coproporphyrinogen III oxidase [Oceanivirga miroungae]|uniref:Putative oxygen independent coproporphyrinogen III oxidase n=1 Tax=Oceanivirga miroungae TaxID=1130046 RepID=A0A6I8MCR1_9FUSO|nr:coproporphyrinogen III oxidase [Oceanivirga miroungae]VWL85272.1 putative oxygen independent coproporphyrinogen III oxidase [Oceanivirga miroungae]
MKIISEIDENKFKEIVYTFFENINDIVKITNKSDDENILIEFENDNKKYTFKNEILFDREKQIQAMTKGGLLNLYGIKNDWGALVGMRPTKLVHKFLAEGKSYTNIEEILKKVYLLNDNKIKLLIDIVKNQIEYIDKDTVALYIGIAFCPTKCTYCSFPAYLKKGKYEKIYDLYIKTLNEEIKLMGDLLKKLDVKINSIYIGGGTPSFLSYDELEELLSNVSSNFNLEYLKEYTFEAGRIDTIDYEKLKLLKSFFVDRISINPQSFKESTLKRVNRYHSIEKLNEVYKMAKDLNFIINMDYILGLPLETTEDILNTIEKMSEYDAKNITIHNLALKKASYLTKNKYELDSEKIDFKKVYEKIYEYADKNGYIPYYMYKQKKSYGENIGFCKKESQSIYNIDMIEENKNVFSIGAGSITKLIKKDEIKRIVMPKDPIMYVNEFKDRIEKKIADILDFYEQE